MTAAATHGTATRAAGLAGVRLGLARGWITWRAIVTTTEGWFNALVLNAIPLVFVILYRDVPIPGTAVTLGASLLPGLLALMIVFSVMGIAHYLATEREDGTLLRAKATPYGMRAYVVGLAVVAGLDAVVSVLVVLLPGMFIIDGVPLASPTLWLGLVGYLLLGLLACLPLGIVIGSVIRSPRAIGGLGFLLIMGLAFVSGLWMPIQALWGWLQVVVQALPLYWLGLGLRSVFLPADAAAVEVGGSWRPVQTVAVLGAWAAVGLIAGPVLLARMARRESGSVMETRRQQVLQRDA